MFKANSAVLNSLLTILNERLFDNGAERISVPLLCLVGASNELPESEELDALYDRFLLRYPVAQVSEVGLKQLLQQASGEPAAKAKPQAAEALQFSAEAMAAVRARAYAEVSLPSEIIDLITELRSYLQQSCEPPVYVSGAFACLVQPAQRDLTDPARRPPPGQGGGDAPCVCLHQWPERRQ